MCLVNTGGISGGGGDWWVGGWRWGGWGAGGPNMISHTMCGNFRGVRDYGIVEEICLGIRSCHSAASLRYFYPFQNGKKSLC